MNVGENGVTTIFWLGQDTLAKYLHMKSLNTLYCAYVWDIYSRSSVIQTWIILFSDYPDTFTNLTQQSCTYTHIRTVGTLMCSFRMGLVSAQSLMTKNIRYLSDMGIYEPR